MKKSIFFLPAVTLVKVGLACGLCLFATSLFAQQVSIGARAGYTLSDVLVKEPDGAAPEFQIDENYRPLSSFHIGVDGRLQLSERLRILATLLYAKKGYIGTLDWPSGPADATWELHYLNLPATADFRLWKGLFLQGGVELGWLMEARAKSAGETFDPQNFSLFEDFDWGLVGGLEYQFPKGFFIGARHIFGIAPLQQFEVTDETGFPIGELRTRNSATQLSVGYRHVIKE